MADRFVNVRIQSMNGVDINRFQFEYDLTWMAFFQNEEGRTYMRYGGREDRHAESHMNKASLLRVMRQTLILHKDAKVQPENRYEPVAESTRTPEDLPAMPKMMSRRKEKCIHCHDVKVAMLRNHRDLGTLEKDMVFTYPSPQQLGIELDEEIQYKVKRVARGSVAAAADVRPGDLIRTVDKQRVLTYGDVTRVLELAPETGSLAFGLERAKQPVSTTLALKAGWKKSSDPSWRSSTGVVGPASGVWGQRATPKQRKQFNLPADKLALRVTFIWGAWARKAGIKNGDMIIDVDGYREDMNIRQFQTYLHLNRDWGDKVAITIRRGKKEMKLNFQFPDGPPNQ